MLLEAKTMKELQVLQSSLVRGQLIIACFEPLFCYGWLVGSQTWICPEFHGKHAYAHEKVRCCIFWSLDRLIFHMWSLWCELPRKTKLFFTSISLWNGLFYFNHIFWLTFLCDLNILIKEHTQTNFMCWINKFFLHDMRNDWEKNILSFEKDIGVKTRIFHLLIRKTKLVIVTFKWH